jgi:mannose-6-phosphate isomerase-like protein (cupin superfamily)
MRIYEPSIIKNPITTKHGETIFELCGNATRETSRMHSVAYVTLEVNKSNPLHFHPATEESYYILKGKARIIIGKEEMQIEQNQLVYIPPMQPHKIFNIGNEALEFLAICAPSWEPTNTVWLETFD